MFEAIRNMSDGWMILTMTTLGMTAWALVFALPVLWEKLCDSLFFRNEKLKRENARLRKYISQLRKENMRGGRV